MTLARKKITTKYFKISSSFFMCKNK